MTQSLSLRSRRRETLLAPPPIAAFTGGARAPDAEVADPIAWLLSDAPTPASRGLRSAPRLGFIPRPHEPVVVDPRPWAIGRPSRTAALLLAGGLALGPGVAHAQDAPDDDTEQTDTEGEEAPPAPAAPKVAPVPAPPAVDPGPPPLSYEGDALWEAVRGARVEITIRGGSVLRGIVLTQAADELAIAREPDGTVARVPKHMVSRLRVLHIGGSGGGDWAELEENKRPQDGTGALVAGTILTITAGSMMLTSALLTAATGSVYYGFPLMIIGSSMLGPGIPLLAWGAAQNEERREWDEANDLRVSFGVNQHGVAAGLRLRF